MYLEDNLNNDLMNNKDINIDNTYDKYIKMMIDEGYIDNNLEPIKCPYCDENDLEDRNKYYEGGYLVECQVYCKNCGKKVGHYAYGNWDL